MRKPIDKLKHTLSLIKGNNFSTNDEKVEFAMIALSLIIEDMEKEDKVTKDSENLISGVFLIVTGLLIGACLYIFK